MPLTEDSDALCLENIHWDSKHESWWLCKASEFHFQYWPSCSFTCLLTWYPSIVFCTYCMPLRWGKGCLRLSQSYRGNSSVDNNFEDSVFFLFFNWQSQGYDITHLLLCLFWFGWIWHNLMVTFKVLLSSFFSSLLDVFIFFKVSFSIRLVVGTATVGWLLEVVHGLVMCSVSWKMNWGWLARIDVFNLFLCWNFLYDEYSCHWKWVIIASSVLESYLWWNVLLQVVLQVLC